MTTNRVDIIDGSVEKTHIWLNELAAELGTEDRILRAVLHAVLDRLTVDETAQASELIRGIYHELWGPSPASASYHHSKQSGHGSSSQLSGAENWSPPNKIAANTWARTCTSSSSRPVARARPVEVERKWLAESRPAEADWRTGTRIEQGYLTSERDGPEVRIRRRAGRCSLTVKGRATSLEPRSSCRSRCVSSTRCGR